LRRDDAADHAVVDVDRQHLGVLADGCPGLPRATGERHRDVGRIGLTVGREERRADHVVNGHQRPQFLRLLRRQQMHLQSERLGGGGLTPDLVPPFLVARSRSPPFIFQPVAWPVSSSKRLYRSTE
jgi:hypothetical protein